MVTSSAFFQRQILPRVSKSLNAEVTVSSAEVHPFSRVVLHDLKVQPPKRSTNEPPLLTAPEARVSYSLMDIIGGNIRVDELTIVSPTIALVEYPDGTSNLDPLKKKEKGIVSTFSHQRQPMTSQAKLTKTVMIKLADAFVTKFAMHGMFRNLHVANPALLHFLLG